MTQQFTIGFPRMHNESGEKRVFLPAFIQFLARAGARIVIEEGYGSRSGYTFSDYGQNNEAVYMGRQEDAFAQDIVMILRCPDIELFTQLKPGSCLISMLHYPTRHYRIKRLQQLGINAISLDSIIDDKGRRLVENMKAVAWNGLKAAFDVLEGQFPSLRIHSHRPAKVLVLGTGTVGKLALEAGTKLGNIERNETHIQNRGLGSISIAVGRNVSYNPDTMKNLFSQTDILVDATQRHKVSKPVVPNSWLNWLPKHTVITDLSVDPYLLEETPVIVRGVEGIPQGNLDKYVFPPNDPNWDDTIPSGISSDYRRTTVTCYSWPGIYPHESMAHYGHQLRPLMSILLEKGYDNLSLNGCHFERALSRGTLREWLHRNQDKLHLTKTLEVGFEHLPV